MKKKKKITSPGSISSQFLASWEAETNNLAKLFEKKYFGMDTESWWVAGTIGDTYYINDRFFNLSDMVDFLRYKYSAKDMFDYYDYHLDFEMEQSEKNPKMNDKQYPINIKNWKKLK